MAQRAGLDANRAGRPIAIRAAFRSGNEVRASPLITVARRPAVSLAVKEELEAVTACQGACRRTAPRC